MSFNPRGYYLERVGNLTKSKILHIYAKKSLLGRDESCEIRIPLSSRTVSRKHCQLTLEDEKLFIENLSKSTCTFLNQDKVRKYTQLFLYFISIFLNQQVLLKTQVEVGDLIGLGVFIILLKALSVLISSKYSRNKPNIK